MSNIFIKPALIEFEGEEVIALVRDPLTLQPLAVEGEWKVASQYWTRRIRDRDVVEASPTAGTELASSPAPSAPVPFAACATCVTPDACGNFDRCVKAPIA